MTTRPRTTLKEWFRTAMKPTQEQFLDAWDSFWHKDEKIPVNQVSNLQEILNNKAEYNHFHEIGELSNLTEELAGKTDESRTDSLQEQIYALSRVTAIRGNVDTFADLLALDVAALRDGDSYIVERDETRNDVTTLYALSLGDWIFTGEWAAGGGGTLNVVGGGNNAVLSLSNPGTIRFKEGILVSAGPNVATLTIDSSIVQLMADKGQPDGYAPLGYDGKVPNQFLPDTGGAGNDTNLANENLRQTDYERKYELLEKRLVFITQQGDVAIQGNGAVLEVRGVARFEHLDADKIKAMEAAFDMLYIRGIPIDEYIREIVRNM